MTSNTSQEDAMRGITELREALARLKMLNERYHRVGHIPREYLGRGRDTNLIQLKDYVMKEKEEDKGEKAIDSLMRDIMEANERKKKSDKRNREEHNKRVSSDYNLTKKKGK